MMSAVLAAAKDPGHFAPRSVGFCHNRSSEENRWFATGFLILMWMQAIYQLARHYTVHGLNARFAGLLHAWPTSAVRHRVLACAPVPRRGQNWSVQPQVRAQQR